MFVGYLWKQIKKAMHQHSFFDLIMITLGTGVGGGIVLNKKLYDGLGGTGAQLGHNLIELGGRPCNCGRKGCFENQGERRRRA